MHEAKAAKSSDSAVEEMKTISGTRSETHVKLERRAATFHT